MMGEDTGLVEVRLEVVISAQPNQGETLLGREMMRAGEGDCYGLGEVEITQKSSEATLKRSLA